MSSITIAEKFRLFVNSAPILTAKYFFNNLLEEDSKELKTYIDEIKTGKTPPKSNAKYYENPDIKWYKPSDIGSNIYLETSSDTVSFEAQKDKKITLFKKDTLLITCIGDIGRIGILQEDSTSNQQITGIKLNDEILPEYAYLYLVSNRELFTDRGVLKTTLPIINQSKIKSILIKVPDKELQEQVINYFMEFIENDSVPEQSSLDIKYKSKIEEFAKKVFFTKDVTKKLESNNLFQERTLTKLKQSILQEAIEGKLTSKWREQNQNIETASVLLEKIQAQKEQLIKEKKIKKSKPLAEISEDEMLCSIPDNWEWSRLGEICFKITDGFHHTPKKIDKGHIYISATHIRENKISWNECLYIGETEHRELYKKAYPQKGEILITNRGAGCGTPAIIDIKEEFSFQNAALIGFNQNKIIKEYVYFFILFMRKQIMEYFVNGGLQPMLSNVMLSKIPIPVPSTQEQNEIVNKIEKLFSICDELEDQINSSKTNTETLMQAVLKEAFEK